MPRLPFADVVEGQRGSIDGQQYVASTTVYPHPVLLDDTPDAAQLLVGRSPAPVESGMDSDSNTWLRHEERGISAYRTILSTGASNYSFARPI